MRMYETFIGDLVLEGSICKYNRTIHSGQKSRESHAKPIRCFGGCFGYK